MEYIITKENYFLRFDDTGRLTYTTNINTAAKFTYSKAEALVNNCIPKFQRDGCSIIPLEECKEYIPEKPSKPTPTFFPTRFDDANDEVDWRSEIENIHSFFRDTYQYHSNLKAKISNIDLEINNVIHNIEFDEMLDGTTETSAERLGYLKSLLNQRRVMKNNIYFLNKLIHCNAYELRDETLETVLDSIDSRVYHPRVTKNLFEEPNKNIA